MLDTGVDRDDISEEVIRDLAVVTTTKNMRVITVDNKIVRKRTIASFTIDSLDTTRQGARCKVHTKMKTGVPK